MVIEYTPSRLLRSAISEAGIASDARTVFRAWPNLKEVAKKCAWFVSPFIEIEQGRTLIADMLASAVCAYELAGPRQQDQVVAFLSSLERSAEFLARHRCSVKQPDGHWRIWNYEQALMDLMLSVKRNSIQTKHRTNPASREAIAFRLYSYVLTFRDVELSGLRVLLPEARN